METSLKVPNVPREHFSGNSCLSHNSLFVWVQSHLGEPILYFLPLPHLSKASARMSRCAFVWKGGMQWISWQQRRVLSLSIYLWMLLTSDGRSENTERRALAFPKQGSFLWASHLRNFQLRTAQGSEICASVIRAELVFEIQGLLSKVPSDGHFFTYLWMGFVQIWKTIYHTGFSSQGRAKLLWISAEKHTT